MNQSPSVDSFTRSSPNPSIKPALQAALSSLDVNLEEELTRYRRHKAGRPLPSGRGLGRYQTRQPIELMSVGTLGMSVATPASSSLSKNRAATTQQPIAQTGSLDVPSSTNTGESLSSQLTLATNAARQGNNPATGNGSPQLGTTPAGAASGTDLADPSASHKSPDDYLASSEQLLRSLAEEEAADRPKRGFIDSVLTPLGVGSILLLLLSSATVGYIVMNPSSWGPLGLDRFWKPQTPTVAQNPQQGTPTNSNQPQESAILNGPNLASGEFERLNLSNLSNLPNPNSSLVPKQQALPQLPAKAGIPASVPPNAGSGSSSDLASAILPPALQSASVSPRIPTVAPIPAVPPTARTPSQTPAAARPNPNSGTTNPLQASRNSAQVGANPAPDRKDYYYVLANYDSDRSLEQTRKIVAEAFVRNFPDGTRIQVATFTKESQAKRLVQQLQKQGIRAWIYRP